MDSLVQASIDATRRNVARRCLGAALLIAACGGNLAAAEIEVLALFREQAVIRVDGRQYKLKPGESTPEGVRLLSADTTGAVLEQAGESRLYALGAKLRTGYRQADGEAVRVYRDAQGMFTTVGSINGMPVDFLVDTGASAIAMNAAMARRLGIDFRVEGERGAVMTASRAEPVYRVMLDSVKVGALQLRNVEAVVLDGPQPQQTLLGMSFLGRLEMQNDGQHLTLRRKY